MRDESREHDVQRDRDVAAREEARGEPARLGGEVTEDNWVRVRVRTMAPKGQRSAKACVRANCGG